jgi:hypothetical protein
MDLQQSGSTIRFALLWCLIVQLSDNFYTLIISEPLQFSRLHLMLACSLFLFAQFPLLVL